MDVDSMTVADLKRELKARNLAVKGAKAELVQRLKDALLNSEKDLDEGQLPDGDLSDEGLLNEDELLKDSPPPVKKNDIHQSTELKGVAEKPKVAISGASPAVVKTVAALQKEGVLQSMEDDLFSDRPAQPPSTGQIAPAPEVTADKLKARAARFGLPEAKLEERAKKFGTGGGGSNKMVAPVEDKQKLMDRAKRFGLPVDDDGRQPAQTKSTTLTNSPKLNLNVSAEELEKLRKRAERFGGNVSSIAVKMEEAEKLAKRKAKFTAETTEAAQGGDIPNVKVVVAPSEGEPPAPKRKPIVF